MQEFHRVAAGSYEDERDPLQLNFIFSISEKFPGLCCKDEYRRELLWCLTVHNNTTEQFRTVVLNLLALYVGLKAALAKCLA